MQLNENIVLVDFLFFLIATLKIFGQFSVIAGK